MPLPKPKQDEKRDDFVSRCVSAVYDEGTLQGKKLDPGSADDRKQAVAACQTAWRRAKEQEPGGPEKCVCPECGAEIEKERGAPCRSEKCPECGAAMVALVDSESGEQQMPDKIRGALELAFAAGMQRQKGDITAKRAAMILDEAEHDLANLVAEATKTVNGNEEEAEMDVETLRDLLTKALDMLSDDDEPEEKPDGELESESEGDEEHAAEFEEVEVNETGGAAGVSITGHALSIAEVGDVATGGTKPLKLEVVPIRPGWGNRRDNNYYSEDALKNGAALFSRVKMFETNHVDEETNNRNWVSTIIETPRFTEGTEPVSVVGVHDPGFAQKVLNLNELGLLGMLECSIRGHGRVRKGDFELDGRKGKYVEALTDISSVDWVSKAGAGGRALGLAESENNGGTDMPEDRERQEEEPTAPAEEAEEVALGEEASEQEPQALTEAEASEALDKVALPEHTKALLLAREYKDAEELDAVVKEVVAEFKAATGSGKPPATRGKIEPPKPPDQATIEQNQDAINRRFLNIRVKEEKK